MANLTGSNLGKYQVMERIGRGGMAEVYKGYHEKLDRYVAIKVLHGFLAEGEDFLARFEREARAVANLRHPNIVHIHDFDVQDDHYYMVMEYVDGGTLGNLIKRTKGHIGLKQILSIIEQVAAALDYAHGQGLIHRDIKPSNILIGSQSKVFLTDFGIARIASTTQFTATGAMIGTPTYMSPEQCRGEEISSIGDIYSLGVILYEMLTGQVPFDAETPLSVLQKHITDPIPGLIEHRGDLPSDFENIIKHALAKDPTDRYQTAGALFSALQEAVKQTLAATQEILPEKGELDATQKPTVVMEEEEVDSTQKPTVAMEEDETLKSKEKTGKPVKGSTKKQRPKRLKGKPFPWKIVVPFGVIAVILGVLFATGVIGGGINSIQCDDPWSCRELGIEAWDAMDYEKAVKYYQEAVNRMDGPMTDYTTIWCEYSDLLFIEERWEEGNIFAAVCFMTERGGEGCESPEGCAEWGYRAWEEGELWQAQQFFYWAADHVPDDQLASYAYLWCERAEIFRQLGRDDLAAENEATCEDWESQ